MEILNIRVLKLVVAAAVVAVATPAIAGPGYRFSSKSPVVRKPSNLQSPKRGYIFGYAGVDLGSNYNTHGGWTTPGIVPGQPPQNVPVGWDPYSVPIDIDLANGATFGGGVGLYSNFWGGSRFELEGTTLGNDLNHVDWGHFRVPADLDIETKAVFVNYLKEIPLGAFMGYLGGGVGYASTSFEGNIFGVNYDERNEGFAWQLIAGVDIPITETLTFFTQYRYLVLPDQSFTSSFNDFTVHTTENPASHSVLFGARVSF